MCKDNENNENIAEKGNNWIILFSWILHLYIQVSGNGNLSIILK
jgi:hypothetical protein